jgi:hypothetical protein
MNVANRTKLQNQLAQVIETVLIEAEENFVELPRWGDSSFQYMALAVINIIEAMEELQIYIAEQLDDDIREGLGI